MPYRPLNDGKQDFVCQSIHSLVPVARNAAHPMREIARWHIKEAMWRWTVDGVNLLTGVVKLNAIKYSFEHYSATDNAVALIGGGDLRHEHAVPRAFLADRIIEQNLDVAEIHGLLQHFCRAAIVTKEEHLLLMPTNTMPDGWEWITGDPYQRYVNAGLVLRAPPPHAQ